MELKDVILSRRSVRKFADTKIDRELIREMLIAAMSAPSACNKRPWEFYVIEDTEKLEQLKTISPFSKITAPLAIVVAADADKCLKSRMQEFWVEDCSAATQNLLLRAVDLGLGTVWCGVYPMEQSVNKVKEVLSLDEKIMPLNVIYVGVPLETPNARGGFDPDRVHYI